MADSSIDAVVTDPPYELNFMGRSWDARGIAYNVDLWRQVLRVLKPGGHLLAFGGTRTYHRMTVAIEDAGFEIRDCIQWLYGSGFPKSHNISKAIDRMAGVEREVVGVNDDYLRRKPNGMKTAGSTAYNYSKAQQETNADITAPATDAAKQWDGWGTALKPSHEPIVLARKPLAEPTIAAQVLATGTGGLNIAATRVNVGERVQSTAGDAGAWYEGQGRPDSYELGTGREYHNQGRWPPNLLLSHSPLCQRIGSKRVKGITGTRAGSQGTGIIKQAPRGSGEPVGYADADGMEEVADYICADECPIKLLDEQAGVRKSGAIVKRSGRRQAAYGMNELETRFDASEGSASRFFPVFEPDPAALFLYAPKASRSEREAGLQGREPSFMVAMNDGIGARPHNPDQPSAWVKNSHPTVKPLSLMRWLCRLIGVPGGVILDPFAGSGTTLVAAIQEGFECVGIEQDESYIAIARARCEWAEAQRPEAIQTRLAV